MYSSRDENDEYMEREEIIYYWMDYYDINLKLTEIQEIINSYNILLLILQKIEQTENIKSRGMDYSFEEYSKKSVEHFMYERKYPGLNLSRVKNGGIRVN